MLRGRYYIAKVCEVYPGCDGRVRKVGLEYKTFRVGSAVQRYEGRKATRVVRSIHKLALLVPVSENE